MGCVEQAGHMTAADLVIIMALVAPRPSTHASLSLDRFPVCRLTGPRLSEGEGQCRDDTAGGVRRSTRMTTIDGDFR